MCAELPHPLGRRIWLRIDLNGLRRLPPTETQLEDSHAQPSYSVRFQFTSPSPINSVVESSQAREGVKSLRGTVQWKEVFYRECYEFSLIEIGVYSDDSYPGFRASLSVAELLEISEMSVWEDRAPRDSSCTLCVSASQVFDATDEEDRETRIDSDTQTQNGHFYASPKGTYNAPTACVTALLHGILCRLPSLIEAAELLKVGFGFGVFWIQYNIHAVYERSLASPEPSHPRVHVLISSLVSTMNAILPVASTYMQQRKHYVVDIVTELFWVAAIMDNLVEKGESKYASRSPEAELARLTCIIVTPDPTIGATSTTADANRHTLSRTIAKDALLFALEAIVQSSDAFPPLKSAASGLMFFATYADLASGNKKQIHDIYKRVDGLATSLKRGAADGSPLCPAHQEAIKALAEDIAHLNSDLNEIVDERKNRFKRFFSAKRHRAQLQDVVTQLETARANYTTSVATVNATTTARVLAHVQTLTLLMGVSPMPALEMCRADAAIFPAGSNRFEEVRH